MNSIVFVYILYYIYKNTLNYNYMEIISIFQYIKTLYYIYIFILYYFHSSSS